MRIRCSLLIALAACKSSQPPPPPAKPAEVIVTIGGKVRAHVVASRPCRAMLDDVELQVGLDPLVTHVGNTEWTGEDGANGTTLRKDQITVARIAAPTAGAESLALIDAEGIPMIRVVATGDKASIVGRDGAVSGVAKRSPEGIVVGDATVTGTTDLALAALLTRTTIDPAIRGMAACRRLVPQSKQP